MAYSRWGGVGSGHWHTFWHCQPAEEKETLDNALFAICGLCQFTAKELRDDIEGCLDIVKDKDDFVDEEKVDELRTYIAEFLEDVKIHYPLLFQKIKCLVIEKWRRFRWNRLSEAKKEQARKELDEALKEFYLPILIEELNNSESVLEGSRS